MYSTKKVHETYWCSSSITCQEKGQDWILRILTFDDKKSFISPHISARQFFWESKWSRSNPISYKIIWHMPNIKSSELKIKNARFFQTPFYFSFIVLDNNSHKFWDQSSSAHIINVVCKYLRQFLGKSFVVATLPIYCNIE